MRNSYYDYHGLATGDGRMGPDRWEPGEKPGPYGRVPGGPVPPENWDNLPEVYAPPTGGEDARRSRRKGARGFPGFAVFLVLLFLLAGAGLYLRSTRGEPASWGEFWEELDPRASWEEWRSEDEEENWQANLSETTIPLADLDPDRRLTLEPAGEAALSPQEIYERVNPAVVEVRAYVNRGYYTGSGVVMTADGYIITNAHIVSGTRRAVVILSDGRVGEARLVGFDGETDLALLKVEASGLETARFGNSADLRVGEPAYAIGNPMGTELRGTMTDGIISAIDRNVYTREGQMTLLQHTAPINSGSSGGALVNQYGQVVGITNMKMMSSQETYEGLGFAIPTSVVRPVMNQILTTREYMGEPMLGVMVYTVAAGENSPAGVRVDSVRESSDAWAKGIRPGDIIVSANSVAVESFEELLRVKDYVGLGETLWLEVWSPETGEKRIVGVVLHGSREMG